MTRHLTALMTAAVVLAMVAGSPRAGRTEPPEVVDAGEVAPLTSALRLAQQNGVKDPGVISFSHSRRGTAHVALTGAVRDEGDSDRAVVVMIMEGAFIGTTAKRPRGAATPTGNFLFVIADAQTGNITDYGMTRDRPAPSESLKTVAVKDLPIDVDTLIRP